MEKLIITNTTVSEQALRNLAQNRAEQVRQYLTKQGQIPAERIFVLAPSLQTTPEEKEGNFQRADFSLK
jgi:hypothetical protein